MLSLLDSICALCIVMAAILLSQPHAAAIPHVWDMANLRIKLSDLLLAVLFCGLWARLFSAAGLYARVGNRRFRAVLRALQVCFVMTIFLGLRVAVGRDIHPGILVVLRFAVFGGIYEAFRVWLLYSPQRLPSERRVQTVILGTGRRATKAWRELRTRRWHTHEFLGFVDDRDVSDMCPDIAARYLGDVDSLADYLLLHVVDELIVSIPMRSSYDIAQRAVEVAEAAGVRILYVHDILPVALWRAPGKRNGVIVDLVPHDSDHGLQQMCKRAIDVVVAAAGLIALAPLFVGIAIAVKLASKGPIFFAQERFGYQRRRFRMYKFRSMVHNASELMPNLEALNEAAGPIFKIKEDPRVTRLGRFLRRSSLDELPQLWNVLRGDMSLVGPRPMSVRDVLLFDKPSLMRRFSVRPGITGLWQVSGRSSFSFDHWIALDYEYIEDWSIELDLKILARTLPAVVSRAGAV